MVLHVLTGKYHKNKHWKSQNTPLDVKKIQLYNGTYL